VADYDGGTISIIDVSLDEYGNDSSTFGTTYTVAVGKTSTPYPAAVTVLNDGSRAYTANQGEDSVTIVDLTSHTVEKTLPVTGNPREIASTQNSLYGKVYVSSPNSNLLTVLTTTTDSVDTTIPVEGKNILGVRLTTVNGSSGNYNNVSHKPGYGQPCYLPGTPTTLTACSTLP